jgi:hypothetical protein
VKRSGIPVDKTARFVLLHGGWRVVATFAIIVAPTYGWVLFYYLSTGAWHQSNAIVRMHAPLLATFFIPLVISAWVIGFRGWYVLIGGIAAALVAGWLPATTAATRLVSYGYINMAIVLTLLMISLRSFQYWRDHIIHRLPIARYTPDAMIVIGSTVIVLVALLLPFRI